MDDRILPGGSWWEEILEASRACELLLVVGISLKDSDVYSLVYDLSARLHDQFGAVIYVDHERIKGRNTHQVIDFHFQVDIGQFFSRLLSAMDEVCYFFNCSFS
jgi:NAD-dependent SIR2 family protein deacetylase